jgi:tetratricopeptide (TPR) repeat protein
MSGSVGSRRGHPQQALARESEPAVGACAEYPTCRGEPEKAIEGLMDARGLDPFFTPSRYWAELGAAYFAARRMDEAIASLLRATAMSLADPAWLAASYALGGMLDLAGDCAAAPLRSVPEFSTARFVPKQSLSIVDDSRKRLAEGRPAGMNDSSPMNRLALGRRSMTFAIKAEVGDPETETFSFAAQKTMYGGKHVAEGNRIFVFASENEGGRGLIARGVVTFAEAIPRKPGIARQTPRVNLSVRRTALTTRRLGRSELKPFGDWDDGRAETELNFKFYRQATNKIVGLSEKAAAFLDSFF